MTENKPDSASFEALSRELLKRGMTVRFQAHGASMAPCINDGQFVQVTPVIVNKLRKDDIVLTKGDKGFLMHRLVVADLDRNVFITRSDTALENDPPVTRDQIIGLVVAKEFRFGRTIVRTKLTGISGRISETFLRGVGHGLAFAGRAARAAGLRRSSRSDKDSSTPGNTHKLFSLIVLLLMLFAALYSRAQVAVDTADANSIAAELTGPGSQTLNFTLHIPNGGVDILMIVGVSLNIANDPTAAVTSVTYNGTALTLVGAHNDASNTRRSEIWSLLAPATGGNKNIVVSVNVPGALTVGAVAGAVSFTGVDQTVPLGTYVFSDGAAGAFSELDVPSVVNGMVIDTLATGGDHAVTIPGPQVSEWNNASGGTSPPDVTGSGSARTGAPAVPISESFSGTSDWSLGAVSVNPSGADVGVTTSVGSAVFLGSSTTYTITVTNNGPSAANTVSLKETLAAGMTLNTIATTVGTCTNANPSTCTLGTMASGATAKITVTATAATAGSYSDTAVVSDSGTPPDPNTGNNTYVAVATVQSAACGTVSQAVPNNSVSGTVNTYYPGTANVAAGAVKIPVGAATGGGAAIAAGNLLLVIQMQDASINDSNTVAYGNGYTGQGFTALNSAGDFEFVKATGPIAAGSVPIAGAGAGGGLVFAYHETAASNTAGQSTYQVIIVPQYTTATFNSTTPPTALPWNGSTGGVLVLDTSGTLNLNGVDISLDGLGFRGAAGLQLNGNVGGNTTDYFHAAPAAYTGVENGLDAVKGEGIAGTPLWVESGGTPTKTTSKYPSGSGADGSSARGAPGNAGAGGTDGDPTGNTENAGGGGGANGGAGGFGGNSWSTNLSIGGEGGALFPATINRVAMGGGGGAGTRNNSDGDALASSGAAGGGIIIIRTFGLSGTGTITANGLSAYNGTLNDAGGGGGAGGSIIVLSANGGESGLTLQANGGSGGNAWEIEPYTLGDRHGPGGGGGGGVVLVSGAPASVALTGGSNGLTETPGVPYGSTPGTNGISVTNATLSQTSGTLSGAQCTPDMAIAKSHVGNFTRGSINASYTLTASNVSSYGPSSGTVIVNDTLPPGVVPTAASGTGWACSLASQTVSCTDATALAAGASYSPITITASVAQTAPATITNNAIVGGGGEVNLANDTATDIASVISSADLAVTNIASPNPVAAGSNITYTQILTNNGPSAADNATIAEAVPANTTFVSFTAPSGWNCITPAVGATGSIVCTDLNMAGSTAATFSLVAKVGAAVANGTVISNSITANSSVSDPNSLNNTAAATTVVGPAATAEMVVTNAQTPDPVQASGTITYTQTSTNVGTGTANNPTLTESTPPNTTFVSITPPTGTTCTTPAVGSAGAISCTAATAPAGSIGTVTLVVKVTAGTPAGTLITDTVNVTSTNQAYGTNSASITDIVATAAQADLVLTTASTPSSVLAGNDITYTQSITNNGPAAAANLSFTEAIPANTTFVSVSAPAGWTCTTITSVTCTASSLAANNSADIIVVVAVPATVTTSPISETASVTSTTSDPNSANNTNIPASTPVVDKCDLAVTNSGTPSPVLAGGTLTYTQTISNTGPSNCSTAAFREATPANTTFGSVAVVTTGGGTWTCPNAAPVSCSNPSVPPGSVATITATYTVNAGTAAGTIITDTATAQTTTLDSNILNNTATSTIGVANAGQADLSITNSATPNPVDAGQSITYTQTALNAGPATATSVTVTETLPANTTFVSLAGPGWTCTSASPYTCTIASLAANSPTTITFIAMVNTTVASGSTITDTASVASSVTDPNLGNNSASTLVQVADSALLSITNTGTPVPVQAANNITYTQVVTNAGPSAATVASLTESTPANTVFQSISTVSGWSCITPAVGSAGTITCTNPSFAVGSASFTLALKVNAGTAAGTAINDTATVNSSTTDPNLTNNSATANDVVALTTQSDLVVTNSPSSGSIAPGSNVTYTQSVTNLGTAVAATGATFTQTTPPNTTYQSIIIPTGWTCTTPAVGASGTITCTATGTIAVNGSSPFTVVLQVSASAPTGTNIAETATATVSNIVPNITTNTATASVIVANATSADMAIVKTASPSPTVAEGDPLTYTLVVTNNGPATATTVVATDPLPSAVTYQTSSSTTGTCSEAGGTVTCQVGTMANGATATITIVTIAGVPGTATNTATVSADPTDPNLTNNTSTQTETITAFTKIQLHGFAARTGTDKSGANRTILSWKTGAEAHNLGFNIYREENGQRARLNSSLIAGSALMMRGALPKHSGKTYSFIDASASSSNGAYWLEDIDVNGARAMHGPVTAGAASSESDTEPAAAPMLSQLNQSLPSASTQGSHPVERMRADFTPSSAQRQAQFEIAAHAAVKLYVQHEGWHRITQPELLAAGLDPNVDPALLHLYAEAIEQPMQITGASSGPGGFGSQAAIEFYGTGLDTPYSGTRVYFLAAGNTLGQRIFQLAPTSGSNQPPPSFMETVEVVPRTIYFAALMTTDGNNFFGPLVSSTPADQTVTTPDLDQTSTDSASIELILQGIIQGFPHDVAVSLNGTSLGNLTFTGQAKGTFEITLPPNVLQEANNTVTLTAQGGEFDTSLLQSVRIRYPRRYVANSDLLKFTGASGEEVTISGFTSAPAAVLDITDPNHPVALTPQISSDATTTPAQYTLQVQVPWVSINLLAKRHTLLALSQDRYLSAAAVRPNHPSTWHQPQAGSEIVMISNAEFAPALAPLAQAHRAQGQSTSLVLIDDVYDEFSFGEHNPAAIKEFLSAATTAWHTAPHYLLLNGRASLDPRNYLGFGHLDFIPTKIVQTSSLMTASDDWFSDFNNSGIPAIATGRFPVSTPEEAALIAGRVAAYEGQSTNGPWTSQALMVADVDDTIDFTQASQIVQAQLPKNIQATEVFAGNMTIAQAQQDIISSINSGQLLVNYSGHGSEEQWSGDDLFNDTSATALTNGSSLPVFLLMNCLNGFFQDVYEVPLGVTLMLAPNGGAVAVVASSGLNLPDPQTVLNAAIVKNAMHPPYAAIGDAILQGKLAITDPDVRNTFNLLGDPAMKIKNPASQQ